MELIVIRNNKQAIDYTNYWESEDALHGLFYLTWNAGAARLLVPDNQLSKISEMSTGAYVIISSGPWHEQGGREAIEVLFEDESSAPYAIQFLDNQSDRKLPTNEHGRSFRFDVWTSEGHALTFFGRYRVVNSIPCLAPWGNGSND